MTTHEINGYLPRKTFYWSVSILVAVVMSVLGYMTAKLDDVSGTFNHNFTTVKVDVAEIKTDLKLLRAELQRGSLISK